MTKPPPPAAKKPKGPAMTARGGCACGAVRIEIGAPAVWAWHDHSKASRSAHAAAYVTWVGSWKSKLRIVEGADAIERWSDAASGAVRSFCKRCGTPISYERSRSKQMINLPRALFESGVGREPRYHVGIDEAPEWAYRGEPLGPLNGYPGVLWSRPRKKRLADAGELF